LLVASCDFNPLGGNKSKLQEDFEPGKYKKSEPPTISAIPNFIIDKNDVETINFTISDPDTILFCSMINVQISSSNNSIIDRTGLTVGGTYPNCTLTIAPKAFQHGVLNVTLTVFDFWSRISSTFQLTVNNIDLPGAFTILDAIGANQTIETSWQNALNMPGSGAVTSGFYTLYYREADTTNAFLPITPVTSPFTITGLTNGTEYEIYVMATNSVGTRQSNTVRAFPSKYLLRGSAIVPMSGVASGTTATGDQYMTFAKTAFPAQDYVANSSMLSEVIMPDANYGATTDPAAIPENPINGNFALGAPKASYLTTPSGRFQVYVGSQGNILSGAGR
jgi:hypothetical protein